jgi:hypothetical protein
VTANPRSASRIRCGGGVCVGEERGKEGREGLGEAVIKGSDGGGARLDPFLFLASSGRGTDVLRAWLRATGRVWFRFVSCDPSHSCAARWAWLVFKWAGVRRTCWAFSFSFPVSAAPRRQRAPSHEWKPRMETGTT